MVTIRSGKAAAEIGSEVTGISGGIGIGVGVGKAVKIGPWPNTIPDRPQNKAAVLTAIMGSQRNLLFIKNLVENITWSKQGVCAQPYVWLIDATV